jgi:hypothetical protein
MSQKTERFTEEGLCCAGCGVEITWEPVRKYIFAKDFAGLRLPKQYGQSAGALPRYLNYCCRTCALGERCECGEKVQFEEERQARRDYIPQVR